MQSLSDQDEKNTPDANNNLDNRFDQLKEQMGTVQKGQEDDQSGEGGKAMGKAMRMGTEFVVAVLVGTFIGWHLDSWFDTKPLFLILLMLVGFGAGINNVLRLTKKENSAGNEDQN